MNRPGSTEGHSVGEAACSREAVAVHVSERFNVLAIVRSMRIPLALSSENRVLRTCE